MLAVMKGELLAGNLIFKIELFMGNAILDLAGKSSGACCYERGAFGGIFK